MGIGYGHMIWHMGVRVACACMSAICFVNACVLASTIADTTRTFELAPIWQNSNAAASIKSVDKHFDIRNKRRSSGVLNENGELATCDDEAQKRGKTYAATGSGH